MILALIVTIRSLLNLFLLEMNFDTFTIELHFLLMFFIF